MDEPSSGSGAQRAVCGPLTFNEVGHINLSPPHLLPIDALGDQAENPQISQITQIRQKLRRTHLTVNLRDPKATSPLVCNGLNLCNLRNLWILVLKAPQYFRRQRSIGMDG